jgi:hypothetical protein
MRRKMNKLGIQTYIYGKKMNILGIQTYIYEKKNEHVGDTDIYMGRKMNKFGIQTYFMPCGCYCLNLLFIDTAISCI